jgi:dolichyl-phosphate beta-glucosyltransferase
VVVADVTALALAGLASYALHRVVTFHGDPYRRSLDRGRAFAGALLAGGLIDLLVVVGLSAAVDTTTFGAAAAVKVPAVIAAGVVRWMLRRWELLLIVRGDHLPQPQRGPTPGELRFSVILPAFGEADRIGGAVSAVRHALADVEGGWEVVVVDDGSTDDTGARARLTGADQVVRLPVNRGKGAAVRAGIAAAQGRTVAFTDADLAYAPEQLVTVLDTVEEGWDIVVGSRRHDGAATLVRAGRLRELGGRVINWLTFAVLLGGYRDTQCGLKGFRSDIGRVLSELARVDGFGFDIELFVIAERNGMALVEIPVRVVNTSRSTVRPARDGLRLVRDLFRIRRFARAGAYQVGD